MSPVLRGVEVGRAILRERGFRHSSTFVDQVGATDGRRIGAHELEIWTPAAVPPGPPDEWGASGVVVLHDYGEAGWDMYLQAAPGTTSIEATVAHLDRWRGAKP